MFFVHMPLCKYNCKLHLKKRKEDIKKKDLEWNENEKYEEYTGVGYRV